METTTKNSEWNSHTQYAFGLYKLITKSLGIWPFDCSSILSKIQTTIVIILQITMMASLLVEIHLDCGEVSDIIQLYSLSTCNLIVLFKVPKIKLSNDKILPIISASIKDWSEVSHPKGFEIMRKNAKLSRFVCLYQMISAYLISSIILLGPLAFLAVQANMSANITSNFSDVMVKPIPIPTVCFYGEMSMTTYLAVYLLQVIQLLATCTANVGCDCYFFGMALHVVGQFEWLGTQFETLNIESSEQECREKLGILVEKHKQLMQFANYLEESFNICIMVILSVNVVQILLNEMQTIVSLRIGDTATVINEVIILNVLNLQIFLYSYAGDRLTSAMENLQTTIYCGKWYNLPTTTSKDLKFIMLRAGKKFNLSAGKVYFMNIDSFKNILKAMLSYFSVMQAMFEE